MENIKQKIKVLSKEQIELRNQRKTVHLKGERTIPVIGCWGIIEGRNRWIPGAAEKHSSNRYLLRHLFIVYAKLRGKEIPKSKKPVNEKLINEYLEKYEVVRTH